MNGNLTMNAAATLAGLSWERFRKVWKDLVRDEGFPAPIRGRVWDQAQVMEWRAQRGARRLQALATPEPPPPAPDRGRRCRQQLAELRRAG